MKTRKKWLFFNPKFVAAIALLGYFNYISPKMFREPILSMPQLAIPYIFQYNLILPTIDIALLLTILYGRKLLKERKNEFRSSEEH